jgi:hypothetical protein
MISEGTSSWSAGISGAGADSALGLGAQSVQAQGSPGSSAVSLVNGVAALANTGGGGSGSIAIGVASATGGAGGSGQVIIKEFFV